MKFSLWSVFLLALLAATLTKVYTLECYYCEGDDCNELDDSKLGYCGPEPATEPPEEATTTTKTPTMSTDDTTTPSDGTTTTPPTTPADTTTTTEVVTVPADTTTTTEVVTVPADTTTTTEVVTVPDTDPATTTTEVVTVPADPTTTTEVATVSADPTTTTEASATVEANPANAIDSDPNTMIVTSDVQFSRSNLRRRSAADLLIRNYRAISRNRRANGISYACYSTDIINDGVSTRKCGCVKIPTELSACEAVRVENNVPAGVDDNCFACLSDGCNNGSAMLKLSATLLLSLLLAKFII